MFVLKVTQIYGSPLWPPMNIIAGVLGYKFLYNSRFVERSFLVYLERSSSLLAPSIGIKTIDGVTVKQHQF